MLNNMLIEKLIPSQNSLRETLDDFIAFVKEGGIFNQKSIEQHDGVSNKLIQLVQFPDMIMIHDGHHRIGSIWKSKVRDFLYPDEYELMTFGYDDYIHPNLDTGWLTPFDPRSEVRKADFFMFKDIALMQKDPLSFIENYKDLYCEKRNQIQHIRDII